MCYMLVYVCTYIHEGEEYEWGGVEKPFQSSRGEVILVEEEQSNEVDDE